MPTLSASCSAAPSNAPARCTLPIALVHAALLLAITLVAGGCAPLAATPTAQVTDTPTPGGSCSLALDTSDPEATIQALINAEGEFVVSQDITRLMALWAEESHVTDAKNTPDDLSDDQSWLGKDAIRHRYVRTVFPGAPAATQPADLMITFEGDRATVRATTQIGEEISPAGDLWELVKEQECWLIAGLTYNLEAQ